ncbi:hypothetical protein [Anaerobutyricum hallii]
MCGGFCLNEDGGAGYVN